MAGISVYEAQTRDSNLCDWIGALGGNKFCYQVLYLDEAVVLLRLSPSIVSARTASLVL